MPMTANSSIDMPTITHKLVSDFGSKSTLGTGFIVDYAGDTWLFTCWHNIGPAGANSVDMKGDMTANAIALARTPAARFDLGKRRVVGATRNGHHLDIAAIELFASEKPAPPYFDGRRKITLEGFNLEKTCAIGDKDGGIRLIVDVTAHYAWQGCGRALEWDQSSQGLLN